MGLVGALFVCAVEATSRPEFGYFLAAAAAAAVVVVVAVVWEGGWERGEGWGIHPAASATRSSQIAA